MPTPNTPSATPIQQAGRSSRGVPHGLDQSLFWKDVKQAAWFVGGFVALGFISYLLTYAGFFG